MVAILHRKAGKYLSNMWGEKADKHLLSTTLILGSREDVESQGVGRLRGFRLEKYLGVPERGGG